MPNYAHAVIYRIINKETFETLYIGSTTNYNQRMREHKKYCINPNYKHHTYPIYKHIRELGGWDAVKHVMIEEYTDCCNKLQLIKKEQEHIEAFASSKNAIRSYVTEEQKKQWRLDNKEKINEQARSRYYKKKNEQAELVQSTTL